MFLDSFLFADSRPLRNNAELLAFRFRPFPWGRLVNRLDTTNRAPIRLLGDRYDDMDSVGQQMRPDNEPTRPKMLVVHDLAGNYRGDR